MLPCLAFAFAIAFARVAEPEPAELAELAPVDRLLFGTAATGAFNTSGATSFAPFDPGGFETAI